MDPSDKFDHEHLLPFVHRILPGKSELFKRHHPEQTQCLPVLHCCDHFGCRIGRERNHYDDRQFYTQNSYRLRKSENKLDHTDANNVFHNKTLFLHDVRTVLNFRVEYVEEIHLVLTTLETRCYRAAERKIQQVGK